MESDIRRPRIQDNDMIRSDRFAQMENFEQKTVELMDLGEEFFQSGQFDQAIHVWTRILFLHRGHPKARKRIDGAKRAIAEQLRKLDLAVVEAGRYLESGQRHQARQQLSHVLAIDQGHAEARALLVRLETLERRDEARCYPAPTLPPLEISESKGRRRRRRMKAKGIGSEKTNPASTLKMAAFLFCALCLFGLGGVYLHIHWDFLVSDHGFAQTHPTESEKLGQSRDLPLPEADELHFYNGARLHAKGEYRAALSELSLVDRQSGFFEEARSLILRIEERLLRGATSAEPEDLGTRGGD